MAYTIAVMVFLGLVYFILSDMVNGYKHFSWLLGRQGGIVVSEVFYFQDGLDIPAGTPCRITVTKDQLLLNIMENTYKIGRAQLKGAYIFGGNTIIERGKPDSKDIDQSGVDFGHLSQVVRALDGDDLKKPMDERYYMVISYQSSSGDVKTIMFSPVREDNMSMGPLFSFAGKINKTYELNVHKMVTVQIPPDDFIQL